MMTRKYMTMASAMLAVLALGGRALADNEKGTAVIKGKAIFEGTPPPMKALPIAGDQHCQKAHPKPEFDQGTIVYKDQGNAIPYVFVCVKSGIKGKYDTPKAPVTLDQKGCMYEPHVFGMIAGQDLAIKSSDPTTHNIHPQPKKNTEFNINQANMGVVTRTGSDTFNKPEMNINVKCNVHGWMSARCFVMTHPFFDVTKDHKQFPKGNEAGRGTFEIKNLPAGEYEIEAWHENFGTTSQKVTVKDGETKEIEFKFGAKKAEAPQPGRTAVLGSETAGK